MRTRVFVYGTLLSGESNHAFLTGARPLGEAKTEARFRLHDLGSFPGLVCGGERSIAGEVYEVDEPTLAKLDELEEHPHLYQRTCIVLADGTSAETYLVSPAQAEGHPLVESGSWRAHRLLDHSRMTTAYDFQQPTIDGKDASLADYRGKPLLIVNVASRCGLTPQYGPLEELYRGMKDRGLVVLGFPCNQFGAQEPGTETEIKQFCSTQFDVTFPMFSKLEVNGPHRHALYAWLTAQTTQPDGPGDIQWNFAKFLVDRSGNVAARFSPMTSPTDVTVVEAIEKALG